MAVPSREVSARYCTPVLTKHEVLWPGGVAYRRPIELGSVGYSRGRRPIELGSVGYGLGRRPIELGSVGYSLGRRPIELATECISDRARNTGLANAGRADEADDLQKSVIQNKC